MSNLIDEQQLKNAVNHHLVVSGDRERLKALLRTRLIESGWNDRLRAKCKEAIQEKGLGAMTMDQLFAEMNEFGRETVSDSIRIELLQQIKKCLDNFDH